MNHGILLLPVLAAFLLTLTAHGADEAIEKELPSLVKLYKELHANPELSLTKSRPRPGSRGNCAEPVSK